MHLTWEEVRSNFAKNKHLVSRNRRFFYVSSDGCRCVVGAMLPDELIDRVVKEPKINGLGVDKLSKAVGLEFEPGLFDVLDELQSSFDTTSTTIEEINERLEENGFEALEMIQPHQSGVTLVACVSFAEFFQAYKLWSCVPEWGVATALSNSQEIELWVANEFINWAYHRKTDSYRPVYKIKEL